MAEPPAKRKMRSDSDSQHVSEPDKPQTSQDDESVMASLDIEAVRIELVCNICLDLPSQVTTVLPCLHSFCWSCIEEWFKTRHKCPQCAQCATSARPNAALNNLVQAVLQADPTLAKPADLIELERKKFDDYRRRQTSGAVLYPTTSHSYYEEDDESDLEPEEPLRYWPCPCCSPGNRSGYVCSAPVPFPEGPVRALGPPPRGGEWPDLLEAMEYISPDIVEKHETCNFCGSWVPSEGAPGSRCAGCYICTCSPYDSQGSCPEGDDFATLDRRDSAFYATPFVWSGTYLGSVEIERVRAYMDEKKLSLFDISTSMLARARTLVADQGASTQEMDDTTMPGGHGEAVPGGNAANNANDQPQARAEMPGLRNSHLDKTAAMCLAQSCEGSCMGLCHKFDRDRAVALLSRSYCRDCAVSVMTRLIGWWWLDIRQQKPDTLSKEIRDLPDCWYGNRCRMQLAKPSHATKYNHLCQQTVFPQPGDPEPASYGT